MRPFIASLLFLISVTALAELPAKSLLEHTRSMKDRAQKSGKQQWENTKAGYLVKLETQKFTGKQDDAFIYEVTWISTNNMVVALRRTPEFSLAFEQRYRSEQKVLSNARALAREGGSSGALFSPMAGNIKMFVMAEPDGETKALTAENQITKALMFKVVKVCDHNWKTCKDL